MQKSFDLEEATIAGLLQALHSGTVALTEVISEYRRRIDEVDHDLGLGAVLEVNPGVEEATGTPLSPSAGGDAGLLDRVPVLLKDNVDTLDGMRTTAGSLALMDSMPRTEAPVVSRLKSAGALILGKTNMSEWANFRSSHSVSGWSGRGGQCRNPYILDRSPCGSSSGSAAAVSANLAMAAIGTETDGSIVCPSGICGVVGVKPTVGLVSTAGVIPISPTQDSVGVHARTVTDAALVLEAIADPAAHGAVPRYAAGLDSFRLSGVRIGVLRDEYVGYSPQADGIFEAALEALRGEGATLIDPIALSSAAELRHSDAEMTLLRCEFKDAINRYLQMRGDQRVATLDQLISFNEAHAAEEMGVFGQDRLLAAADCGGTSDPKYAAARADCQRLGRQVVDSAMDGEGLDAIVALTSGPAWLIDRVNGDHSLGGSSQPAALAGYPLVTVPAGYAADELPIGVSFMGKAFSEARLLQIAFAFERATTARRRPRLLRTLA